MAGGSSCAFPFTLALPHFLPLTGAYGNNGNIPISVKLAFFTEMLWLVSVCDWEGCHVTRCGILKWQQSIESYASAHNTHRNLLILFHVTREYIYRYEP